MKVDGHVFVVTGGASGLGEATIRAVCAKGGKGIIFDIPKQAERANAIVQELGAENCVFIPCDVTNEESIAKAIEAAGSKWGKIHGNINCVSDTMHRAGCWFATLQFFCRPVWALQ